MSTDLAGRGSFQEQMDLAALAVFETMFMTSIESAADWSDGTDPTLFPLVTQVRFEGALKGEFRIHLEERTASALAATMLCLEPEELTSEDRLQLAEELTNIVCGRLLSDLEPEGNLRLGSPSTVSDPAPLPGGTSRRFGLPEGILVAEFRLDSAEG